MKIKKQLNELTEAELSLLIYTVCTRLSIGYYTYLIRWLNHKYAVDIDTAFFNRVSRDYGQAYAFRTDKFVRYHTYGRRWLGLEYLNKEME